MLRANGLIVPLRGMKTVARMMSTIPVVIKSGTVVNADGSMKADVCLENGIITQVGTDIRVPEGARVIDATGKLVMPGGIDPHVHMELPFMGTVSKDDFFTGTAAGLAGGTTMLMDFAIPAPGQSLVDAYKNYRYTKATKACADYGLHMGITAWDNKTSPKEVEELTTKYGINSFKMFMAYKGSFMMDDEKIIECYASLKKYGALPMVHAENGYIIAYLQKRMLDLGITGPEGHGQSRPACLEAEAVHRITTIAQVLDTPVYVVHVMSKDAMEEVRRAKMRGVRVIGEPVLAGLTLDESKMYDKDWLTAARHIMSPPLRPLEHQKALWDALGSNVLDLVGTDHCVFNEDQKMMGRNDFTKIPNGLHGIEDRLSLVWDIGVHRLGKLTPNDFVRVVSTKAAQIFNMFPRKGAIRVGSDADVVVFNPEGERVISQKTSHQNMDYNAFEGWKAKGTFDFTISQGNVVWENGRLNVKSGAGRFIPTPPWSPVFGGKAGMSRDRFSAKKVQRP
jgi:dihydropyrimidinase